MKSLQQYRRSFATILFILLFHYLWKSESAGINLILTEILLLAYIGYSIGFRKTKSAYLNLGLYAANSMGFLLHGSNLALCMNLLSFCMLCSQPFTGSENLLETVIRSLLRFIPFIHDNSTKSNSRTSDHSFKWYVILVPLLIISAFSILYANAIQGFADFITDFLELFPKLDFESMLLLVFGFLITLYCWRGPMFALPFLSAWFSKEEQERFKRMKSITLNRSLLHEYHTYSITLVSLILLISLALFFDIVDLSRANWKYESYEQVQGGVHSGTAALVIAIIASAFLAVYVFRGNLQFFPKSRLKNLTYTWLSLNALLCLTLAYRSFGYIQVYNLAYKRIAVLVFIICALYGLYTVYLKISKGKSISFVLRHNLNMVLISCSICTLVHWDKIIVNYNLSHPESYLDYDFIYSRELGALIAHKDRPELKQITLGHSPNYRSAVNRYGSITVHDYLERRMAYEKVELERLTWKSMYLSRYRLAQNLKNWK